MQYQNDDMDELFRRAANGYSLKIQENNWDAVAGKLTTPPTTLFGVTEKKSKKNIYKYATLFILFFVIGGATTLIVLNNNIKNPGNKNFLKNRKEIKENIVNEDYLKNSERNKIIKEQSKGAASILLMDDEINATGIPRQMLKQAAFTKITNGNAETKYTYEMVKNKNEKRSNENNYNETKENIKKVNNEIIFTEQEQKKEQAAVLKKNESKNKIDSAGIVKEKKKKATRFYAGFFAGPQFNQVKSQGFSNAGVSAGFVVGINLSKKMAVETGLFISQKKYYSSGKYFNMKTIDPSMPAGMKVISLNGKSKVFEIPIKVKYNFGTKNKGNFFGAAGATSYILTNENNNYLIELNGNRQKLPANYSKNKKYFDAALNLSVGYEYKLKQTTLRVEPYLQIPLKQIGIGSMSVMSTGINVGVTLPLQ